MIDYNKPDDDPIVAEVRRAREEFAAGFNYDLRAICEECSGDRPLPDGNMLRCRRVASNPRLRR